MPAPSIHLPAGPAAAPAPQPRAPAWPTLDPAQWEPVTTRLGAAFVALLPVLLLAAALDGRDIGGVPVWNKPLKFAVAFAVYLLSLGWCGGLADARWRARRWFRWPVVVGAAAIAMEQGIVTLQAARGVGSHFNFATPLDAALYGAMGVGALLLTAMALPFALAVARSRNLPGVPPALRHAVAMGLVLTCVLTLVTAGTMAVIGGHWVGGAALAVTGTGQGLFGWLRDAGDLRAPHFFATHAMHAVPLLVLAVGPLRRGGWRAAAAVAAAYTGGVGFLFMQALAGRPFPALPVFTG